MRVFAQPTEQFKELRHPHTGRRYCDVITDPRDVTAAGRELFSALQRAGAGADPAAVADAADDYARSLFVTFENARRFRYSERMANVATETEWRVWTKWWQPYNMRELIGECRGETDEGGGAAEGRAAR